MKFRGVNHGGRGKATIAGDETAGRRMETRREKGRRRGCVAERVAVEWKIISLI